MSLQVENLTRSFGDKRAVDGVSFTMTEPGVFGLIGTNGAGKTTTIRMMLGILAPDCGSATWEGVPISRETLSFGYMPEERGIYMKTKVIDQLLYFAMLRGMTKAEARASAEALLERLGMTEYRDSVAEKLSKGNQQKIQLIAALVHRPKLVVLDEPFSGLDPINTELLRELIRELVAEGRYIVMSSHQMATVEEFCRDVLLLDSGKTVMQGNLRRIKAAYGHTNLILRTEQDVSALAERAGLQLLERRADEEEYHISGDAQAEDFLRALLAAGISPIKYEIREPSLHQLFLEKAGGRQ